MCVVEPCRLSAFPAGGGCSRSVTAAQPVSSSLLLRAPRRCSGSGRASCPRGVQDAGGGLRNLPHHGGQHQRQLRGVAALRGGAALLRLLQQPQRAVSPHADPRPARPGERNASRFSLLPQTSPPQKKTPNPGGSQVQGSPSCLFPDALLAVTSPALPTQRCSLRRGDVRGRAGAVQQLGTVTAAVLQGTVPSCSSTPPPLLFLRLKAASSALEQENQDSFTAGAVFDAKYRGPVVSALHPPAAAAASAQDRRWSSFSSFPSPTVPSRPGPAASRHLTANLLL